MQIAYPVQLKRSQEPYGVIRRHPFSTLFHPFFVDFGYDKIIYYHMVIGRSNHIHHFVVDVTLYILPQVFGVNIPHKRFDRFSE